MFYHVEVLEKQNAITFIENNNQTGLKQFRVCSCSLQHPENLSWPVKDVQHIAMTTFPMSTTFRAEYGSPGTQIYMQPSWPDYNLTKHVLQKCNSGKLWQHRRNKQELYMTPLLLDEACNLLKVA